jgi:hypothetical protein
VSQLVTYSLLVIVICLLSSLWLSLARRIRDQRRKLSCALYDIARMYRNVSHLSPMGFGEYVRVVRGTEFYFEHSDLVDALADRRRASGTDAQPSGSGLHFVDELAGGRCLMDESVRMLQNDLCRSGRTVEGR